MSEFSDLPEACQRFCFEHGAKLRASGGGEWRFALRVLALVPGLDWSKVGYQVEFRDGLGKRRYTDFVLVSSSGRRIALEVDGWDKKGTGAGMDRAAFDDFLLRQNALVACGYEVLRFSNDQVTARPEDCAAQIARRLAVGRVVAPAPPDWWGWLCLSVLAFGFAWFLSRLGLFR